MSTDTPAPAQAHPAAPAAARSEQDPPPGSDAATEAPETTTSAVPTPGRESGTQVVVLGLVATLTVIAIDLALTGRLSFFFDLCFIMLCLGWAVLVRRRDFFTVGVLPPLMMVGVFTLVALIKRNAIAQPDDSLVQAVISGLAHHSGGLAAGYFLCLATLALRQPR